MWALWLLLDYLYAGREVVVYADLAIVVIGLPICGGKMAAYLCGAVVVGLHICRRVNVVWRQQMCGFSIRVLLTYWFLSTPPGPGRRWREGSATGLIGAINHALLYKHTIIFPPMSGSYLLRFLVVFAVFSAGINYGVLAGAHIRASNTQGFITGLGSYSQT